MITTITHVLIVMCLMLEKTARFRKNGLNSHSVALRNDIASFKQRKSMRRRCGQK